MNQPDRDKSGHPPSIPVGSTSRFVMPARPQRGVQENPLSPLPFWLHLEQAALSLLAVAKAAQGKPASFAQIPSLSHSVPHATTLREAYHELLSSKRLAQRSSRYLRQLRVSLSSFGKGHWSKTMDQLTPNDVSAWLNKNKWTAKTQRNYLTDLRTFFSYAIKREYLSADPSRAIELPPIQAPIPAIHTAVEASAVLEHCRSVNLRVCRLMAIRYFAGLRSAEASRLREEDLLLGQGFIQVPAIKSKTRARRLVPISENLRAWLALGGELSPISDHTIKDTLRGAPVAWQHNVTRHSWCSYRLAFTKNAAHTALEAGHSEAMLFRHYRAVVTEQAAKEFFAIVPKAIPDPVV